MCTGAWQDKSPDERSIQVIPIVSGYTFLFYVTLTIAFKLKGEKKPTMVHKSKYNNASQVIDLSNLVVDIITTTCMIVAMWSFGALNKLAKDPSISENQYAKVLRSIAVPCLFLMVTVQALHHFLINRHLRMAIWRIFFS